MSRVSRQRGQPLYALAGLMGLWALGRVAAWSLVTPVPYIDADARRSLPLATAEIAAKHSADLALLNAPSPELPQAHNGGWVPPMVLPAALSPMLTHEAAELLAPVPETAIAPTLPLPALPLPALPLPAPALPFAPIPVASVSATHPSNAMIAGGHQLMYLAAFRSFQLPAALIPRLQRALIQPGAEPRPVANRWSADGWLLLRRNSGPASLAGLGGNYGASQVGAVLRYRIDRTSPLKPSLYLRATTALNGTREQEAAFGFSARPIASLPLIALAEARVSRSAAGIHLRPAAMLVTELPPLKLPLGLKGESYIQAGYVGGYGASAFIDGQARIDRKLFSIGKTEIRAGAAAWGGAQKGASRLDVGPSASLSFRLENTASARLSADWRFRVAGRAAPASGPALTLSAGF